MKKKALLTIMAMLTTVSALADTWQDPETKVNYEYIVGKSEASVGYSPDVTGDITILSKITVDGNEYTVTCIGNSALSFRDGLTGVTIPESVTTIDVGAFWGCSALTTVNIPEGVTKIGNSAFYNCSALTSINIPEGVTYIGGQAFHDTGWYNQQADGVLYLGNWLVDSKGKPTGGLVIKDGTKHIAEAALIYCDELTSVTIPESVTYIGGQAFYKCTGLTSVTIPNSVTSIDGNPFGGCGGLNSISVESGNSIYDSRDNCNAIIETATNTLIRGCNNTIIPESITSIGNGAFSNCSALTSITIPGGVTSIGENAFSGCSALTNITLPEGVTSIGFYAFSDCSGLTSITIPSGVTSIDHGAFENCSSLNSIAIPEKATNVGRAFEGTGWYNKQADGILYLDNWLIGCKGNKPTDDIVIKDGTKGIAGCAFQFCENLTSVTIPESVSYIGEWAFNSCSSLTSINLPSSVTSIGKLAFEYCRGLTSITIPENVTSIGDLAFLACRLTVVKSLITNPFDISANVFEDYSLTSAYLIVPQGTKAKYKAATGWKEFKTILEISDSEGSEQKKGDINGDGKVDIVDVTTLIDMILSAK